MKLCNKFNNSGWKFVRKYTTTTTKEIIHVPIKLELPREHIFEKRFDYELPLFGLGVSFSVILSRDTVLHRLPVVSLTLEWKDGQKHTLNDPFVKENMATFEFNRKMMCETTPYCHEHFCEGQISPLGGKEVNESVDMSMTNEGMNYLSSDILLGNAVCFYRCWRFYSSESLSHHKK
jgi:hypothetical protein